MKRVFGDTFYWIALLNPRDNWHKVALNYAQNYPMIVMKQMGITEVLTNARHFSQEGFTLIFTDLK